MIVECNNCGKDFPTDPYRVRINKNNFCTSKCMGEFRRGNLIGQEFGQLKVLEFDGVSKSGNVKYKCECSCKRIISVKGNKLNDGQLSCKNCKSRQYIGKISGDFFSHIRLGAKRRNLEFNITKEQLWELYQKQNGKCKYSGLDIQFSDSYFEHNNGITTASLDRVNSLIGYNENNIQFVHKYINFMKWNLPEEIFLYYVKNIVEFNGEFVKIEDYQLPEKHGNFKGFGEISGHYWSSIKNSAKNRKIQFNLDIEDVWCKYLEQGGVCYWSGLPIQFYPEKLTKESRKFQTASIDRVDSNGFYEIGNIVVSHKNINSMKQDFNVDEFLFYCKEIYNNCNLQEVDN